MLSTKIKGGSGLSTNYVIRSTKNPKGGGKLNPRGGKSPPCPPPPPEINPAILLIYNEDLYVYCHTIDFANVVYLS